MFGLSWGQITIIVLVGLFLLGPERIPTAVQWVTNSLRRVRTMAAGAQAQLRSEIGPELEELRRQVADLQSLKEIQELRNLRDLNPRNLIGKSILGDEFSGGVSGFLGLDKVGLDKDPLAPITGSGIAESVTDTKPAPSPEPADTTTNVDLHKAEPEPAVTAPRTGPTPFDSDAT